jgi:nucleotide-binding universal stress UspA family protein
MTLQESEIRTGDVVVGHDGSRHSTVAVEWAAAEAARRACRLQILLAIPTDELGLPIPVNLSSPLVPGQDSDVADLLLDHARRLATKLVPEDAVRTGVVRRKPAPALLAASAHAALVVTGSRGHGAVGSALLGSVSTTVAEHAACPVVIVRGTVEDVDHPRAVTVGVDGTAASAAAAEFAADAAARRRATLRIVSAWMPTTRWHRGQVDVPPRWWPSGRTSCPPSPAPSSTTRRRWRTGHTPTSWCRRRRPSCPQACRSRTPRAPPTWSWWVRAGCRSRSERSSGQRAARCCAPRPALSPSSATEPRRVP